MNQLARSLAQKTLSICLLVGMSLSVATAAEPAPQVAEQITRFSRLLSLEDPQLLIDKPWAVIETGPSNAPKLLEGWVVDQDTDQIQLLDWQGDLRRLRFPSDGLQRPALVRLLNGKLDVASLEPSDYVVAWEYREIDFAQRSREFLQHLKQRDRNAITIQTLLDTARYTFAAWIQDDREHALELFDQLEQKQQTFLDIRGVPHEALVELDPFLDWFFAAELRTRSVLMTRNGHPFGEIAHLWLRMAMLPDDLFHEDVKKLVAGYQLLVGEEGTVPELSSREIAALSEQEQVDYWMYHLRNYVSMPTLLMRNVRKEVNPALELKKLGDAAIPTLIEHMTDMRPTRCQSRYIRYRHMHVWPLRYGDCCVTIFEDMTKHQIFDREAKTHHPTYDGVAAECQAKAQAWWDAELVRRRQMP
ncbi:hypothetical protein [Bremerella cremea]|uniref:hypothetical protein n=1 Tax=Bremerella cremea TaxID=1031537 RepID=UPI0031EBF813